MIGLEMIWLKMTGLEMIGLEMIWLEMIVNQNFTHLLNKKNSKKLIN